MAVNKTISKIQQIVTVLLFTLLRHSGSKHKKKYFFARSSLRILLQRCKYMFWRSFIRHVNATQVSAMQRWAHVLFLSKHVFRNFYYCTTQYKFFNLLFFFIFFCWYYNSVVLKYPRTTSIRYNTIIYSTWKIWRIPLVRRYFWYSRLS